MICQILFSRPEISQCVHADCDLEGSEGTLDSAFFSPVTILSNIALILVSQDYKIVFDSSWWPPPDGTMSTCFGCCC